MKALIITANGFQDQELLYPYYRLKEDGYEVNVQTSDGNSAKGILGITVPHEVYNPIEGCDLLVIPGGVKAMEKLRLDDFLVKRIRAFHESGKVIASICSGAQLLISAGLCKNRTISAYPAMKIDVENAGGTFVSGVVNFDRIVSAPHYRDLGPWMRVVLNAVEFERAWRNQR